MNQASDSGANANLDLCRPLHFPNWATALGETGLGPAQQRSSAVTIRWYLSFCRRSRVPVSKQSARDFIAAVEAEHRPPGWKLAGWKEAIRWFFRAGREQERVEGGRKGEDGATARSNRLVSDAPADEGVAWEAKSWQDKARAMLRVRHYSYRTEQTYLEWSQRFAAFYPGRSVEELGAGEVREFLEDLAVRGQVSASTQRQALNALVFLFREALGRDLGDFSDYQRARARSKMPVVLTREEVRRLLEAMDGKLALMAKVMYGSGLRLMELVRLRVKDVDLERRQITVRQGKGGKDRVTTLPESVCGVLWTGVGNRVEFLTEPRRHGGGIGFGEDTASQNSLVFPFPTLCVSVAW